MKAAPSKARAVAAGAAWSYLAQIFTVFVQLGYAAVTSRLLDDSAFGVYAAAFASAQLISLLATAGLWQAIGRMTDLSKSRLLGLLLWGTFVGLISAVFLFSTANLWAALWGSPDAASSTRILALLSFLAPLLAFGNGLSYRLGTFRQLAVTTFASNVLGMLVGVVVVLFTRHVEALAVSPILAQALIVVSVLIKNRERFGGTINFRDTLHDIGYSSRAAVSAVLSYSTGNIAKIGVSQAFGLAALGQWNRADALTTAPFYQLQAALITAVYPEFRHDRESQARTRRVWADLITILAWICIPLSAIGAAVIALAVHLVLGPGWQLAADLAPALILLAGIQASIFLLVGALESLGRFSWIWGGYAVNLTAVISGTVAGALTRSFVPVLLGIGVGLVAMHAFQIILTSRAGLLDARRLLQGYAKVLVSSAVLGLIVWLIVDQFALLVGIPLLGIAVLASLIVGGVILWRSRWKLWPLQLVREYGLLGRR